jgi:enoyl-[acyl-carrier-protein] reductase (NADH)
LGKGSFAAQFFHEKGRIIGLTSEGSGRYIDSYAAVSIAKASLQSLVTYMAVELSKYGLRTNLIQAGVTETPSLKMIPGSRELIDLSKKGTRWEGSHNRQMWQMLFTFFAGMNQTGSMDH